MKIHESYMKDRYGGVVLDSISDTSKMGKTKNMNVLFL